MKKQLRRPREFSWPVLPVLDAFVYYDLIEKYNGTVVTAKASSSTAAVEVRDYVDACVRKAEREVLHRLTDAAQDFGHNVSLWHPKLLKSVAKRCPREAFPEGLGCLQNLHILAARAGVPTKRMGDHMLALERWRVLGGRASSLVTIVHDDFPDDPSEWDDQKWKAYFRRFPQELFSLSILAAVLDLADVEPYAFNEREQWVYKRFLPDRTWRPEHVAWDEYDVLPDEDPNEGDEGEERKPWE